MDGRRFVADPQEIGASTPPPEVAFIPSDQAARLWLGSCEVAHALDPAAWILHFREGPSYGMVRPAIPLSFAALFNHRASQLDQYPLWSMIAADIRPLGIFGHDRIAQHDMINRNREQPAQA